MVLCVGPTLSETKLQEYQECYGFYPELEDLAEFYSLISSPIRLKIIHLLREEERVCVCDLKDIFSVSAPAMSQHLAKLKAHKVVKSVRQGQTVFYSLKAHPFLDLIPELSS